MGFGTFHRRIGDHLDQKIGCLPVYMMVQSNGCQSMGSRVIQDDIIQGVTCITGSIRGLRGFIQSSRARAVKCWPKILYPSCWHCQGGLGGHCRGLHLPPFLKRGLEQSWEQADSGILVANCCEELGIRTKGRLCISGSSWYLLGWYLPQISQVFKSNQRCQEGLGASEVDP